MRLLGNIIWFVFGGVEIALEYFIAGLALCVTIVGIPFGLQAFKLGQLAIWPFGAHVTKSTSTGCLSAVMNIIWFFVGGFWIALTHLGFGLLFALTIVGLPFAKQHFKLMHIALLPFGRTVS